MTTLLKKYSILAIASILTTSLLKALIIILSPHLPATQTPDGVIHTYNSAFLENGIDYLINIIFVFLLYREMKKLKFMSVPVLILTFFSGLMGVIFLIIINAYENLTTKQIIK